MRRLHPKYGFIRNNQNTGPSVPRKQRRIGAEEKLIGIHPSDAAVRRLNKPHVVRFIFGENAQRRSERFSTEALKRLVGCRGMQNASVCRTHEQNRRRLDDCPKKILQRRFFRQHANIVHE